MSPQRKAPWFRRYEEYKLELAELRERYKIRCIELGGDFRLLTHDQWDQFISIAVRESNLQEGIKLERGRSAELTDVAHEFMSRVEGPYLKLDDFAQDHEQVVSELVRNGNTNDEIAAFNLSTAHRLLRVLNSHMQAQVFAALPRFAREERARLQTEPHASRTHLLDELENAIKKHEEVKVRLRSKSLPLKSWYAQNFETFGELRDALERLDWEELARPMRVEYLHFLHTVVLTGIEARELTGCFRETPIHIGGSEVVFPPASMVPTLMKEYCDQFPILGKGANEDDPILMAAQLSHRFVKIHPYADGNGRISRLIMNLVLYAYEYLPAYLSANSRGRHRYIDSLNRANNGEPVWLAALIGRHLVDVYKQALDSIS